MAPNKIITLNDSLLLTIDAIAVAEKGLLKNPSKEEERSLNRNLAELELKRAGIRAMLNALIAKERDIKGPTIEQVEEISRLTAEVDSLTNAALTASGAVGLSSRILSLATEVATA